MKRLISLLAVLTMSAVAFASTTIVLDPGPSTNYLGVSCGGQQMGVYAQGFDANNNAVTGVKVTTNCPGSGRGAKPHHYQVCAIVTYDLTGAMTSNTVVSSQNTIGALTPCPFNYDGSATYELDDGNGNLLATESTADVGSTTRAVLELP